MVKFLERVEQILGAPSLPLCAVPKFGKALVSANITFVLRIMYIYVSFAASHQLNDIKQLSNHCLINRQTVFLWLWITPSSALLQARRDAGAV